MKTRIPLFRGLHAQPPRWLSIVLAAAPFILVLVVYLIASEVRHRENPQDKLLPTMTKIEGALEKVAINQDKRSGLYETGQNRNK